MITMFCNRCRVSFDPNEGGVLKVFSITFERVVSVECAPTQDTHLCRPCITLLTQKFIVGLSVPAAGNMSAS